MPPFILLRKPTRSFFFILLISALLITWLMIPLVAAPSLSGARIEIKKYTNGEDADDAPGPQIPVDANVTWTYNVTNRGNVALSIVSVDDDKLADDPSYVSGDTNGNNKLDLDETWTYEASGTAVPGQYKNTGCVVASYETSSQGPTILIHATEKLTGSVDDCDVSHYIGTTKKPSIDVEKFISPDNGITWLDIDDPSEAPFITSGNPVLWKYNITNTGDFLLQDILLSDTPEIEFTCSDIEGKEIKGEKIKLQKFEPHDTITCYASGTALDECPFHNVVNVSGRHGKTIVEDNDGSYYWGCEPGSLKICKFEVISEEEESPYLGEWGMQVTDKAGSTIRINTSPINGCAIVSSLIPGLYTVTEDTPSEWMNITPSLREVTVVSGEETPVTFKNIQKKNFGNLTVCKYNLSEPYGEGWLMNVSGPFGYGEEQETGVTSCTLFSNLVPGTYTVQEDMPPGWKNLSWNRTEVAVDAGEGERVDFINARKEILTTLQVCKENGTLPYDGGWNMTLSGPFGYDVNQTTNLTGCTLFENLVRGEQYTVSEEERPDWINITVTSKMVVAGEISEVKFRNLPVGAPTNLTVCKLNRTGSEDWPLAGWLMNITGPGYKDENRTGADGCVRFEGLSAGQEYSITEELPGGWLNITDTQQTITAGRSDPVTFINAKTEGETTNLTVCKLNMSDPYPGWNFTVMGPGYPSRKQTTDGNGCTEFKDLIIGTQYSVTEDSKAEDGWRNVTPLTQYIIAGTDKETEFINVPPGFAITDLTVEKTVNPSVAFNNTNVIWQINVTNYGPDDATDVVIYDTFSGEPVISSISLPVECDSFLGVIFCMIESIPNATTVSLTFNTTIQLPTGTKTNQATAYASEFDFDPNESNNTDDAVVTITSPSNAILTLVKFVIYDDGGTAKSNDFNMTIDGGTVKSGTSSIIEPGIPHTLNETQVQGYEFYGITGSAKCPHKLGETITLDAGESATCTITNNDIKPVLNVTKHVVNDNGGQLSAEDFTIEVDGNEVSESSFPGSESGHLIGLDAGYYNVSESPTGPVHFYGYTTTYSEDCEGTIKVGELKNCTITNDDKPAHLKLVKYVSNDDGGSASPSDWNLSADGSTPFSNNGTAESDVNASTYELTESGPAGYIAGLWECEGFYEGGGGGYYKNIVRLMPGESVTCTITNDDIPVGNLPAIHGFVSDARTNTPIEGITVNLTGTEIRSTKTDEQGHYLFDKLALGTYTVEAIDPNYTFEPPFVPVDVTTAKIYQVDFEATPLDTAKITGTAYVDENGNGQLDGSESLRLDDVTITLNLSGSIQAAITGADGNYTFADLPVDTSFRLNASLPDGYFRTTPGTVFNDTTVPEQVINFGYAPIESPFAVIFGIVFDDTNSNGQQDFGEPGLADANVTLDGSNNFTTTCNGLICGTFTFIVTDTGIHTVDEVNPPGYRSTTPDDVYVPVDSLGKSYYVDFGDTNRTDIASIYGTVFDDCNGNGRQDSTELGIEGVAINLTNATGHTIDTVMTKAYGQFTYGFEIAESGYYTVWEQDPAKLGYRSTTPDEIRTYVLLGYSYQINFGDTLCSGASFFGTAYEDANANGEWDLDEIGLEGVNVTFSDELDPSQNITKATNSWGQFTFLIDEIGSYRVTEENLPGYVSTNAIPGDPGNVTKIDNDTLELTVTVLGTHFGNNLFGDIREESLPATITACKGNVSLQSNVQPSPGWMMVLDGPGSFHLENPTGDNGCVNFSVDQPGTYILSEIPKQGWTRILPVEENITLEVTTEDILARKEFTEVFYNYNGTMPLGIVLGCKANISFSGMEPLPGWEMVLEGPEGRKTSVTGDPFGLDDLPDLEEWYQGCAVFLVNASGTYTLSETLEDGWTKLYPENNYTFVIEEGQPQQLHGGVFYNYNGTLPLGIVMGCKAELSSNGLEYLPGWEMKLEHNGVTQTVKTGDPFGLGNLPIPDEFLQGCAFFLIDTPGTYNLTEELSGGWTKILPEEDMYSFDVIEGKPLQGFFGYFVNYNGTLPLAIVGACKVNITTEGGMELLNGWMMTLTGPGDTTRTGYTGDPFGLKGLPFGEDPIEGCVLFPIEEPGVYNLTEEERAGWIKVLPEEDGYTFTVASEPLGQFFYPGIFYNYNGSPPIPFAIVKACKYDGMGSPLSGWQMNLLREDISYKNQITNESGCTVFIVNETGKYSLFESMQEGWQKEVPAEAGYEFEVSIPEIYNFTFNNTPVEPPYSTIAACKNDTGGALLPGWQMNLLGEDGSYQNGMTDDTGCTVFTVNTSGNYTLFESMQENWTRIEPSTAEYKITVTESRKYGPYTFENQKVIEPFAWIHACKNDTQDVRLIGWEMVLSPSYAEITDNSGCTVFTVSEPGSYSLAETPKVGWVNITPSSRVIDVGDGGHFNYTFVNNYSPDFATITACKKDNFGNNLSGWQMNIWREEDEYYRKNWTIEEDGCTVFTVKTGATYELFETQKENWTKTEPIDEASEPMINWAHYDVEVTEPKDYRFTFVNEEFPEPYAYVKACKNDAAGKPLIGWVMVLSDDSRKPPQHQSGMTDDTGCTVFTINYSPDVVNANLEEVLKPGWVPQDSQNYGFQIPSPGRYNHTFINLVERPAIDIEKSTNGVDADTAPGPSIQVGSTVTWSYNVTNIGSVPLTNIYVTDNLEGWIDTKESLGPGHSWTISIEGKAKNGLYSNIGNVTAWYRDTMVTDEDPSHYTGTPGPGPTPPPGPPGGGGSYSSGWECDFLETGALEPNLAGVVPKNITICAKDGIGRLIITKGSIAKEPGGLPLEFASIIPLYWGIPQGTNGDEFLPSGHSYDLLPYDATFNAPAQLKMVFSPEKWAGLEGKNLVLGMWNADEGLWEEIPITVNEGTRTITATITRLGQVGLFDRVPVIPPVEPGVQPEPVEQPEPVFNVIPYLLLAIIILLAILVARWWTTRPEKEVPGAGDWMPGGEFILPTTGLAEREAAFASIINILNDVDGQLKDLEVTVSRSGAAISPQDATAIVDRFFITAQMAEERMKDPEVRQFLTTAQIEQLNTQLQSAVSKMGALSRRSEPLLNAIQARYGEAAKI